MTVWVVGANGYIGRSLVEYLEAKGYEVRGIGRGTPLPQTFKYNDVVVNCACKGWKDGDEDPLEVVESNVLLPLDLERKRNGAVMIHLSSGIELAQPGHFYAKTKGVASEMLSGRCHVLYLYAIFGGKHVQMTRFMSSLIKACAKDEPYTITTPYHTRDFVHIDRLCEFIEGLLSDRDYRTQHVGTGRATAFVDALWMLREITDRPFDNVAVDDSDSSIFRYASPMATLPDTLLEDMEREWKVAVAP